MNLSEIDMKKNSAEVKKKTRQNIPPGGVYCKKDLQGLETQGPSWDRISCAEDRKEEHKEGERAFSGG